MCAGEILFLHRLKELHNLYLKIRDNKLEYILPFAGLGLNRESGRRIEPEFLEQQLAQPNAEISIFQMAKPLLSINAANEAQIVKTYTSALSQFGKLKSGPIFAGLDVNNIPQFLIEVADDFDLENSIFAGIGEFCELRGQMQNLPLDDLALLGLGRSLFDWHNRHGFCANCGDKTELADGGWKRYCPSCNTEHFPRTDPVVIMLAIDGDKCLMGHNKRFPSKFYSSLAGFIEPGESIEEACRREVFEEAGIEIGDCKIIGSQPWPFPSQLMIGLIAEAKTTEIKIDKDEIEDARWFTKDEARAMISGGAEIDGETYFGPNKVAIANYLIKYWVES